MSDDEFDLDLSNFEAVQHARMIGPNSDADYGPEIEAPPWDDERGFHQLYSEEVLWKASLLVKGRRIYPIRPDEDDDEDFVAKDHKTWTVEGSQPYVVHLVESEGLPVPWATCSCPNGDARGGRPNCYHTAAVLSLVLGIDLSDTPRPEKKRP